MHVHWYWLIVLHLFNCYIKMVKARPDYNPYRYDYMTSRKYFQDGCPKGYSIEHFLDYAMSSMQESHKNDSGRFSDCECYGECTPAYKVCRKRINNKRRYRTALKKWKPGYFYPCAWISPDASGLGHIAPDCLGGSLKMRRQLKNGRSLQR